MNNIMGSQYKCVIREIGNFAWAGLNADELYAVATAYYYFSVQFRENLIVALSIFPGDEKLIRLKQEECDTANLSPWPGVAASGERMDHDEFMRRALRLSSCQPNAAKEAEVAGVAYLKKCRNYDLEARALSIASYEDGGLEATFRAILSAPVWEGAALDAFRHFLVQHIEFDSDPDEGHGALSRHLQPNDRVLPMWEDFRDLLVRSAPRLSPMLPLSAY